MPRPGGNGASASDRSLQRLWELAQHAAQRPGNFGGPLKVLEMLMGRADFLPKNGGKA